MSYIEKKLVATIEIQHGDNSKSRFSGTKKQINDYIEYLQSHDDIKQFYFVGHDYVELW